jgi:hypothetical protein
LEERLGNTLEDGATSRKNFLADAAWEAFQATKQERRHHAPGLFNEDRLVNNLLSSQPLCFNFFGELKEDKEFARIVLQNWIPDVREVTAVLFEFAPSENYIEDHTAFDVAVQYLTTDERKGLFGLECKYTDSFSAKEYDTAAYRSVFEERRGSFRRDYLDYIGNRYNQLFRNQLIAESLILHRQYDVVTTGLFCHQDDKSAMGIGGEFRGMLFDGSSRFRIITYMDFISSLQRMDISAERREWTALLWARYGALALSEAAFRSYSAPRAE